MTSFEKLMTEARGCLGRGDEKHAGRLMLDAVETASTPEQCAELEQAATAAAENAGFMKKGRFKSAADLARARADSLTARVG